MTTENLILYQQVFDLNNLTARSYFEFHNCNPVAIAGQAVPSLGHLLRVFSLQCAPSEVDAALFVLEKLCHDAQRIALLIDLGTSPEGPLKFLWRRFFDPLSILHIKTPQGDIVSACNTLAFREKIKDGEVWWSDGRVEQVKNQEVYARCRPDTLLMAVLEQACKVGSISVLVEFVAPQVKQAQNFPKHVTDQLLKILYFITQEVPPKIVEPMLVQMFQKFRLLAEQLIPNGDLVDRLFSFCWKCDKFTEHDSHLLLHYADFINDTALKHLSHTHLASSTTTFTQQMSTINSLSSKAACLLNILAGISQHAQTKRHFTVLQSISMQVIQVFIRLCTHWVVPTDFLGKHPNSLDVWVSTTEISQFMETDKETAVEKTLELSKSRERMLITIAGGIATNSNVGFVKVVQRIWQIIVSFPFGVCVFSSH